MSVRLAVKIVLSYVILSIIGISAYGRESNASPFMPTKGKTSQPVGHHEFCASHADECAVRTDAEARILLTPQRWNTLVAVNRTVNNKIAMATDASMYGRPEVWAYPTSKGDCEDLVLLKRKMLIDKGWPVGALLITVARQENGEGHAVLTVLTDRGDLVLDNLRPHILPWNQTHYQYIKRQSEFDTGAWVSVDDARTNEVSSLKN